MNCKFCKKSFKTKQCLDYHYENNVCVDKSKVFCKICIKYYKNKFTFKRHCKLKHPHINICPTVKNINKEFKCLYCNKLFSTNYNLKIHIKNKVCINKSSHIIIKNSNINNITNNNIFNNNIINISLNNFGNEDISSISNQELINIIKRCYNSVSELFKRIHIDIPQNRNIYISNYKEGNISVYNNGKWNIHDAKKILKQIQDININIIDSFYKSNINNFSNNKSIEKMMNDYYNHKLTNKYNKDIKLILENNKNVIKKNKIN